MLLANRVDFVCAYIEGSTEEMPEFDHDFSTRYVEICNGCAIH